jgi:hypothetical protein
VKLSKARLEPIPETQWSDKVKETLREIKVDKLMYTADEVIE